MKPALVALVAWVLFTCLAEGVPASKRSIRYSDIHPEFRSLLNQQGIYENNFSEYVRSLDQRTAEREASGENDHLIYYALQSQRFTGKPRIEPALSAYEFVHHLGSEERSRYLRDSSYIPPIDNLPPAASSRFNEFIRAIKRPSSSDERLAYFRSFIQRNKKGSESLFQYLYRQYARSMRFLYRKEFSSREVDRRDIAAYIASLYTDRGHSTDTQIEANFAVYISLGVIKMLAPSTRLNSVLIVGPGLDFAPRTDLIDLFEPQSYQPFAIADALLGLGLSDPQRVRIHCVDINDRVIRHLQGFSKRSRRTLSILSAVPDSDIRPLSPEYKDYFRELGKRVGIEATLDGLPAEFNRHLRKSLVIRKELAEKITAQKLNIITERDDLSPRYDLVVVTNVFQYFNPTELLLSLTNIHSMMGEGAYLIHNEPREIFVSLAKTLGLTAIQSRMVLIAANKDAPLYDTFWIHRK